MKFFYEEKNIRFNDVYELNPISRRELAARFGYSYKAVQKMSRLNEILSKEKLLELICALEIGDEYLKEFEFLLEDSEFVKGFPFRALTFRKMLEENSPLSPKEQLLRFFRVASEEAWEKAYLTNDTELVAVNFSECDYPKVFAAWFRSGEILYSKEKAAEFCRDDLELLEEKLLELAYRKEKDFLERSLELCRRYGINIGMVPSFPQVQSGAVGIFCKKKPLLIFSNRYYHEALFLEMLFEALEFFRHNESGMFVKDMPGLVENEEWKKRAENKLLSEPAECQILVIGDFSSKALNYFSREFKVPLAVIVYRLQKLKKLKDYFPKRVIL